MNILLAIHHPMDINAGAAGVTWRLGQEYKAHGHKVEYFSFDNLPQMLPEKLKALLFPYFLAWYLSQRKRNFNVVVASTGDSWFFGKYCRSSSDKKPLLVAQCHGLEHLLHEQRLEDARLGTLALSWKYPIYHGGFRLWEVATSLRYSDLCFFLNQEDADYAVNRLDVISDAVRVIPNGIPQHLLGLPFDGKLSDEIKIAQIGTYIPRKGIEYSKIALNNILRNYPNVKVTFLGTLCDSASVFKDFDSEFHERLNVIPKYEHEQLPILLSEHQVKIFPTLSEGFGLALIEAMACGLAPIASDVPGPRDIVSHDHDGILVNPRDSNALEVSISRMIEDRAHLNKIRIGAYASAQKYSWSEVATKRLHIYEQLAT